MCAARHPRGCIRTRTPDWTNRSHCIVNGTGPPTAACERRWRHASRFPARATCSKRRPPCRANWACSCTRTPPNSARKLTSSVPATGMDNLAYLTAVGLASSRLCAAHCVHVGDAEQALLAEHAVKVLHCPSSNLKLGSGVAPVTEMRARGISVSLARTARPVTTPSTCFRRCAWQPPCRPCAWDRVATRARRRMDGHSRRGPGAGTRGEIGVIAPGARADLIVVATDGPHHSPAADPYSTLVYGCRASDVRADGHRRRDPGARWPAQLGGLARAAGRANEAWPAPSARGPEFRGALLYFRWHSHSESANAPP
jgi:hypothetical protein